MSEGKANGRRQILLGALGAAGGLAADQLYARVTGNPSMLDQFIGAREEGYNNFNSRTNPNRRSNELNDLEVFEDLSDKQATDLSGIVKGTIHDWDVSRGFRNIYTSFEIIKISMNGIARDCYEINPSRS